MDSSVTVVGAVVGVMIVVVVDVDAVSLFSDSVRKVDAACCNNNNNTNNYTFSEHDSAVWHRHIYARTLGK